MKLRIKELCQLKGIKQKDLARMADSTEVTISRASKGNASLELIERIAIALDVSVSELFEQPDVKIQAMTHCPHCGKPIVIRFEK